MSTANEKADPAKIGSLGTTCRNNDSSDTAGVVKHPFRLLLAKLPWGLDALAWWGLAHPKRDGWRAE
jgi:hypothetical protein